MFLGILQFDLLIHDAQSLKDKRRVVKSVKDRLHREHMVSVAEVGSGAALEIWNVARMGLAAVSNDGKHLSDLLDRIIAKLGSLPAWGGGAAGGELGDFSKQIIGADQLEEANGADEALWTPEERRDETGA